MATTGNIKHSLWSFQLYSERYLPAVDIWVLGVHFVFKKLVKIQSCIGMRRPISIKLVHRKAA